MAEFHEYGVFVQWKNFRGFADTGRLDLKPVTILIGSNSAGKTSVFMPLLLLAQTLASPDPETAVITRGPLANAGDFKDIAHNHDVSKEIAFRLAFHLHAPEKNLKAVGKYPPGGIEVTFRRSANDGSLELVRFEIFDWHERPYVTGKLTAEGLQVQLASVQNSKMKPHEQEAVRCSKPINFMYSPTTTIAPDVIEDDDKEPSSSGSFSKEYGEYLVVIGAAFQLVRRTLRTMSYIGPVRERLHRFYEVAGFKPDSVGSRGRLAPELFHRMNKADKQHVNRWVKKFELGSSLKVDERGPGDIFSLTIVSANGTKYNVADTGFGVSQVLPLIIQAIAGAPHAITIAEQPEIHLNPRLQGMLADLFVEMASRGQRIVVETHSEHLVLRLRRLIAEGKISSRKVGLHFVERKENQSRVIAVPIDDSGHIQGEHWPSGFFDEPLKESLALAQAQSRKRLKDSKAKTQ